MKSELEAINTFSKGLSLDLNPLTAPADVLSNCLNGTFITFNGNEYVLQNDMGNGRVESAYLAPGYVPIGCKEFGGVIYVASYNPLTNKGQVGSFPSPERNISSTELSDTTDKTITGANFGIDDYLNGNGDDGTFNTAYKLNLFSPSEDTILRSGDKFSIMIAPVESKYKDLLYTFISNYNNVIIYKYFLYENLTISSDITYNGKTYISGTYKCAHIIRDTGENYYFIYNIKDSDGVISNLNVPLSGINTFGTPEMTDGPSPDRYNITIETYIKEFNSDTYNSELYTFKIKSPKNKAVTLKVAIIDSNNNLRDITNDLKRIYYNFDSTESITSNATEIPTDDILNDEVILNLEYWSIPEILQSNDLENLDTYRSLKALNTYNSKIFGQMYIVATLNTIDLVELSIYGNTPVKNGTAYSTTLSLNVTYKYNCPDGIVNVKDDAGTDLYETLYGKSKDFPKDEECLIKGNKFKIGDTKINNSFSEYYVISGDTNVKYVIPQQISGNNDSNIVLLSDNNKSGDYYELEITASQKIRYYLYSKCKALQDTVRDTTTHITYYYSAIYPVTSTFDTESKLYTKTNTYTLPIDNVNSGPSDIRNYSLTPQMVYGDLNGLKISGSIDLWKLGSGELNLNTWRYYASDTVLTLNWGFEHYMKETDKYTPVNGSTYIDDNGKKQVINVELDLQNKDLIIKFYNLSGKNILSLYPINKIGYNGSFTDTISLSEIESNDSLSLNSLYLAEIILSINSEAHIFYSWVLTTGLYNLYYFTINNFNSFNYKDVNGIDLEYSGIIDLNSFNLDNYSSDPLVILNSSSDNILYKSSIPSGTIKVSNSSTLIKSKELYPFNYNSSSYTYGLDTVSTGEIVVLNLIRNNSNYISSDLDTSIYVNGATPTDTSITIYNTLTFLVNLTDINNILINISANIYSYLKGQNTSILIEYINPITKYIDEKNSRYEHIFAGGKYDKITITCFNDELPTFDNITKKALLSYPRHENNNGGTDLHGYSLLPISVLSDGTATNLTSYLDMIKGTDYRSDNREGTVEYSINRDFNIANLIKSWIGDSSINIDLLIGIYNKYSYDNFSYDGNRAVKKYLPVEGGSTARVALYKNDKGTYSFPIQKNSTNKFDMSYIGLFNNVYILDINSLLVDSYIILPIDCTYIKTKLFKVPIIIPIKLVRDTTKDIVNSNNWEGTKTNSIYPTSISALKPHSINYTLATFVFNDTTNINTLYDLILSAPDMSSIYSKVYSLYNNKTNIDPTIIYANDNNKKLVYSSTGLNQNLIYLLSGSGENILFNSISSLVSSGNELAAVLSLFSVKLDEDNYHCLAKYNIDKNDYFLPWGYHKSVTNVYFGGIPIYKLSSKITNIIVFKIQYKFILPAKKQSNIIKIEIYGIFGDKDPHLVETFNTTYNVDKLVCTYISDYLNTLDEINHFDFAIFTYKDKTTIRMDIDLATKVILSNEVTLNLTVHMS